jgi:hypothetical protein
VLSDKSAEIAFYCLNTDCSASGEEARGLTETGLVEGNQALGSRARGGGGENTVSEGISASAPRIASPTAALLSCLVLRGEQSPACPLKRPADSSTTVSLRAR